MEDKILQKLPGAQKNVLLAKYTTYKIGGPAKYFFVAKTKEDLMNAIKIAKEAKLPVFILGGGSNLLISEKGFKGLVIKIDISNIEFNVDKSFVGAGVNITKLSYLSAEKGLSGLEWASGMPGTVGGAIYGHAQAFGTKVSEVIESVEAVDSKSFKIVNLTKEQCKFSLKNSVFKKNRNLVIISAVLHFKPEDAEKIKSKIKEFLEYRKTKHPTNFPSAGSVFVNPEIKIKNKKLLEKFPELKEFNEKGTIPAGFLIAKSGLAGNKIGNAQISEKHANFIINLGGADAKSVMGLIKLAQKKVKKNFGVLLEPEVQFIGF
ncbi:MAG: UDP-N-acetylmuramate dehydrogenase [Candidatus Staskawiczbacteria bacterium]|nr:UDP-N-acetylmuramate dehydrogenase [Candidatus Staskawiczbacteria bacterium]